MEKREKIILVVMAVTLLYGAFDYLFLSAPDSLEETPAQRIEALTNFLNTIGLSINAQNTYANDRYCMQMANTTWDFDPFIDQSHFERFDTFKKGATATETDTETLLYTGFIAAGPKILAIINQVEYEVGDMLGKDGLIKVVSISPQRVIVANGNGSKRIIPIDEGIE